MSEAWKLSEHYRPGMTRADVERAKTRARMRRLRSTARTLAASPIIGKKPAYVLAFLTWRAMQHGWKCEVADTLWCRLWWHDERHMPKPPSEILYKRTVQVSPALARRIFRKFNLPDQLFHKCTRHVKHNDCRPTSTGGRPCASAA